MRLKILAAVVFGLVAVVVVPLSTNTPAGNAVKAQLAARTGPVLAPASAARMHKPAPTPTPTAPPAAATDCTIIVPAHPLTAHGLATPYQLTEARGAPKCSMSDPGVTTFVQAAVIDPASGQISMYNPLVVDRGAKPAIAPTVPVLPAGGVVGIWFGYSGASLTLAGAGAASCTNGIRGSIFGQYAYCNAGPFFAAANAAKAAGKLKIPALGTAADGKPCPTTRDFMVVDQDPADNTTTSYLIATDGSTAQNNARNAMAMVGARVIVVGSDEGLLARKVDVALACTPMKAPDLADPDHAMVTGLPLNELQAAAYQAPPVANVPTMDPMVDVNGQRNLAKLNLYRLGVDQPQLSSFTPALTTPSCRNLLHVGLPRIAANRARLQAVTSPDAAVASNLFNFLATRFQATFSADPGFLNCTHRLHMPNPVTVTTDANGVVTGATLNVKVPAANAPVAAAAVATPTDEAVDAAPQDPTPQQGDAAAVPAAATKKAATAPVTAAAAAK